MISKSRAIRTANANGYLAKIGLGETSSSSKNLYSLYVQYMDVGRCE